MRIWLSWSSGKDSAWALHELLRAGEHEVAGLLTTLNEEADRVAMHGVRRALLEQQARAARLPLIAIGLPWPCDNDAYAARMSAACERARAEDIEGIAFGDLFLEDIRAYREAQLAPTGLAPLFPLWGRDTHALARAMTAQGLRAKLACVDTRALDASFAGADFEPELFERLPAGVDPCGENGEFHTFVTHGPMLAHPIPVTVGETVDRDGFVYADLLG